MSMDIRFSGGPYDGRRGSVTEVRPVITAVYVPPVPLVIEAPRPSPWKHPVRWFRWTPPPVPGPPELQQLTYRDTGEMRDGARVFAIDADWPWFKGPEAKSGGDLHGALVDAMYAVHPMVRGDAATRWVMDLGWYRLARAFALREGTDPDEWRPSPDDRLFGIRIMVTAGGGAPHLENRRYPADWPAA